MFKVAFSGAQNTGKTTNARFYHYASLKIGLNSQLVEEAARGCPYPLDESADYRTQEWILDEQIRREKLAEELEPDLVVCDRSVLDTLVYSRLLHRRGRIKASELEEHWLRATSWIPTYNVIKLCGDYPMVNDGIRNVNVAFRKEINEIFEETVKDINVLTKIRRCEM
jgi:hypothetical protein